MVVSVAVVVRVSVWVVEYVVVRHSVCKIVFQRVVLNVDTLVVPGAV